jgi:hypothetical protein
LTNYIAEVIGEEMKNTVPTLPPILPPRDI